MSDPKKTLPDVAETAADLLMAAAMMAKPSQAPRFNMVEAELRKLASDAKASAHWHGVYIAEVERLIDKAAKAEDIKEARSALGGIGDYLRLLRPYGQGKKHDNSEDAGQ